MTAHAAPVDEAHTLIKALLHAEQVAGRTVLDAGCGAGDYTAAFVALGARAVAGVDLSVGSLAHARRKTAGAHGVHFAVASLSALPLAAASFDMIWAWGVLHYVPDWRGALGEMARLLRPGGVAVIHTLRAGFWSGFERRAARLLSRTPAPLQRRLLDTGEWLLPLAARLAGKGAAPTSTASTSKTMRQKLHERFFVPGPVGAFRVEHLREALAPWCDVHEAHPPVSDLFGRGMSLTILATRRAAP